MSRPMQISPPRVTSEVHAWLMEMSGSTGLSVSLLVGALLERARQEGWIVLPPRAATVTGGEARE